jgi:uncharacterized protein YndB with AHSA1/START domain
VTDQRLLVVERRVAAKPATVFRFFTEAQLWMRWQGTDAQIEARVGGIFRVNVRGDGYASGRFVEVVDGRRVVFTWGWERPESPVQPGSTTVEIDLIEEDTGTLIRLTHTGLPAEAFDEHNAGWTHYVARLAELAEGREPGPDPYVAD